MTAKRKKVYLLYPPISKMERYSSAIGSVGGEQIPLGIFCIAAYLREHGYTVAVTDAEAQRLTGEDILREIDAFRPDYVGIGATTVAFHRALGTAAAIRERHPGIPLILGGPHVTSNPDHALSSGLFDYGVIGEGEATALELFDALSRGIDHAGIPGLAFRNRSGRVVRTPRRELIGDLDTLPFPAYDLIPDLGRYAPPPGSYRTLPVINMITSRGCPGRCTFCDRNVFGRRYRERSAGSIFREIRELREKYGIREIAFVDDTFLVNRQRIYELFRLLRESAIRLDWTCMARVDNVDYDFLRFLRENGCWNIAFGIESADEEILRVIRKELSPEQAERVVDWCCRLGIRTKGFFIVGHPLETEATIEKTIAFACRSRLDAVVVTLNTPIPGSPQYQEAAKYGRLDTADWSRFNYWRPVFVPEGLTEELLLRKQREFYLRFYLSPRRVISWIHGFFGRGGTRRLLSVAGLVGYVFPGGGRTGGAVRDVAHDADGIALTPGAPAGGKNVFVHRQHGDTAGVPQVRPQVAAPDRPAADDAGDHLRHLRGDDEDRG